MTTTEDEEVQSLIMDTTTASPSSSSSFSAASKQTMIRRSMPTSSWKRTICAHVALFGFLLTLHFTMFPRDDGGVGIIHQSVHDGNDKAASAAQHAKVMLERLQSQFDAATDDLLSQLRQDYGDEALEAFFFAPQSTEASSSSTIQKDDEPKTPQQQRRRRRTVGRSIFRSGDPDSSVGWDRARDKLTLKLIRTILRSSSFENNNNNKNDGAADSSAETTHKKEDELLVVTPFVWATAGPSTAAGHGNFLSESYTAVLERAVSGVFRAVGMSFTGRNYGMSAATSAMELALCSQEVYGHRDTDILLWDFALTDGSRNAWGQKLFQYRVGRFFPTRPVQLALRCTGAMRTQRVETVRELAEWGLPILVEDQSLHEQIVDAIPDSFGKNDTEIDAMPPLIRNFRCNGLIEFGDPYCTQAKFNLSQCPNRLYKMKWHPGWKYNALLGNLMALFLVELLEDSLQQIAASLSSSNGGDGLETLRSKLQARQDADYEAFMSQTLDLSAFQGAMMKGFDADIDFDDLSLTTSPVFCHTARRPAEIRHKGILTESSKTGITTCDPGTWLEDALAFPDTNSTSLRLVHDHERVDDCPIPTHQDSPDYFFVSGAEGHKSLRLPNNAELREYGTGAPALRGYVAVCFQPCRWRNCDKDQLLRDDFLRKFQLTVNGIPVDSLGAFQDCHLLKSNSTGYLWQPSADGRLDVGARVSGVNTTESNYLRIGAILVW